MGNIKIWGSMQAIGLMSLLLVFYIEVLSAARLLLGYSVWGADCYIAFILSAVTCFMLLPDLKDVRHIIVIIIFFALFLFVCIYAYGQFYSADYDGNTYHKMAVGLLKNGWNPLQESAGDFAVRYFHDSRINSRAIWIDHYGKASWIFAANIYAITGNIECGKVYQILAMESLFCLAVPYLAQRGMKKWAAVLCGFILALNPVSLVQVFSYYVDGFLFSYLFILILGLTQLVDSADTQSAYAWMIVFSSMAVLANIKFTGLLYGGIYCIAYYFLPESVNLTSNI